VAVSARLTIITKFGDLRPQNNNNKKYKNIANLMCDDNGNSHTNTQRLIIIRITTITIGRALPWLQLSYMI